MPARKSRRRSKRSGSSCKPNAKKRSAKRVRGCDGKMVCVRYGSKEKKYSIKKHRAPRKKSFCARHKCEDKYDPATPGYQSCKAWNCKTLSACKYRGVSKKTKKQTKNSNTSKIRNPKTGRMVLRTGSVGKKIVKSRRKKSNTTKKTTKRTSTNNSKGKGSSKGMIRNPKTGRMVSRSGSVGKKIIESRRKKKTKSKTTKPATRTKRSSTKMSKKRPYVSASGRKYTKCWPEYVQKGWKKNSRGSGMVPNCVKRTSYIKGTK